jgi:hypothetical protein
VLTSTTVTFLLDLSKFASNVSSVTIQHWSISIGNLARMVQHNNLYKLKTREIFLAIYVVGTEKQKTRQGHSATTLQIIILNNRLMDIILVTLHMETKSFHIHEARRPTNPTKHILKKNYLSNEICSSLGGVIFGISSDIATTEFLNRNILYVEANIVTRNCLLQSLVVHLN